MELLPQPMISPLILLVICYFYLGTAIDCGGNNIAKTITIDKFGRGGAFRSIQAGIDSIQSNNDQWVKIHINAGVYIEKVSIPYDKPCIILEGEGSRHTVIIHGDTRTATSWEATFTSSPPNVIVSGIAFKLQNTFNLVGGQLPGVTAKIEVAVAAVVAGDKSSFFNCAFQGYQDTLIAAIGRHYFKDCYIQGEVDFIAGAGQSYFENCTISVTQAKGRPPGFITAQSRASSNDPDGFVFEGGSVDGIGVVNLGRAWGPYSRVIFHKTYFSSVVIPEGWNSWNFYGQEGKITYAEVDCIGPGANNVNRVPWKKNMTPSQLQEFSKSSFINKDGWLDNIPIKY
ncbi:probable pectinesterase 66 [Lotus japonicus]|uniref:probable pectinesterase 66 n=1 Tax=Lotus japonicus TaxID=34305 RepID=UPI0025842243|nr:probable pectinesterase 66 [Lotus japonicus]